MGHAEGDANRARRVVSDLQRATRDERPGTTLNLLIKSTNWVGDAVLQTPALRALRRGLPGARITLVARPWVAPLFRAHPDIDALVVDPEERRARRALVRHLRRERWDIGIAFPNSLSAALLLWRVGARRRVGHARDARRLLLTDPVPLEPWLLHVHETEYHLHVVRGLVDTEAVERTPVLAVDPQAQAELERTLGALGVEAGAALLAIGAGAAFGSAKRWPPARFAACARALRERHGLLPALIGSEGERDTTAEVARLVGEPVVDLAGRVDLAQLVALLGQARLFVTNDSGPMHIAAALGTPTVAIFGSTNWRTTGPLGPRATLVRTPVDCAPCLLRHCPIDHRCMERVSVERVLEAAEGLLHASALHPR